VTGVLLGLGGGVEDGGDGDGDEEALVVDDDVREGFFGLPTFAASLEGEDIVGDNRPEGFAA